MMFLASTARVRVAAMPVADFHLMLHETGSAEHRRDGRVDRASPGRAMLHAPGHSLVIDALPYRALCLGFKRADVERALAEYDLAGADTAWPTGFDLDEPMMASLASFCRWLGAELEQPEGAMLHLPRALAAAERTLLSMFAELVRARLPEPVGDALGRAGLCDLVDWMNANFADPIGIEDMASVAGTSVRSMQLAFRRAYGVTPSAALLDCRLRHARACLERPVGATSVTQVALDCGFFHLGRFAAQYRRAFGEKPSETLRRGVETTAASKRASPHPAIAAPAAVDPAGDAEPRRG
jgi:AraC-like DNA-binding protein